MNNKFSNNLDYIDLNVVILPDEILSKKLIELSQQVSKKFDTSYTLNLVNHFPHLSLYSARYPAKNKDYIKQKVSEIVSNTKSFQISLENFSLFSGYFFYDAQKTKELIQLHQAIVDGLNPLREGLISDNQRQLKGLSPAQQKAIDQYGYVSVKELYMPHISLTHIQNYQSSESIINFLPKDIYHFSVETVALGPFAEFGTFPGPLYTFSTTSSLS